MTTGVTLRSASDGRVQFQGRPEDVSPDQLAKLRAYRDELAPIIETYGEVEVFIGPASRYCGLEVRMDYSLNAKLAAERAFSPDALDDPAELTIKGEMP
jgi:hypothetical protein